MSKKFHNNDKLLTEIEEKLTKEGAIFKKRILNISKRDNINNKNNNYNKNMKNKIKSNGTFNETEIPLNTLRKKNLYYKKLNIQTPKIFLDLNEKETIKYNGHISPRIPKIIFQNGDIPKYSGKNFSLYNNKVTNCEKKFNYKKYNKIIINNIFEMNKGKENNINLSNINNNSKQYRKTNNKMKNKIKSNEVPKNKNSKQRKYISNYTKQITNFALKKENSNFNKYKFNNSIMLGSISPRNNNQSISKTINKYYKSSNNTKETTISDITLHSKNNSKINLKQFNPKKNCHYNYGNISEISLENDINKNKYNLNNFDIFKNNNEKLETHEIKIKNSKLIDYIKKSKSTKKDINLNSSLNNMIFNLDNKKRNLSFNIFNNYKNSNPLLYTNDDSLSNNNITRLTNSSIFSNNNNISERRVIFNRKIDYKKNKYNGDYLELAKIGANQEKIISDLVKNVQNLNNQICDKDLCINELNNQLYSIKYDLLNTLEKTNGKS